MIQSITTIKQPALETSLSVEWLQNWLKKHLKCNEATYPIKYFMCIDKTSIHYNEIMTMLTDEEAALYEVGDIIAGGILKVVSGVMASSQFATR